MGNKKLVVFDVAGTTIRDDDLVSDAFISAFVKHGVRPSKEEVDAVMGMSKREAVASILKRHAGGGSVDKIHSEFNKLMTKKYYESPIEAMPGAVSTFESLKAAGYCVALDTGFPRNILNIILEKTEWVKGRVVDAAIAGDEVSSGRPYPYMIFRLMESLKISSVSDVVKVGDTLVDVEEGLAAGCGLVVGVTSGTCTREQFERSGLNGFKIVDDITKLPGLLGVGT